MNCKSKGGARSAPPTRIGTNQDVGEEAHSESKKVSDCHLPYL